MLESESLDQEIKSLVRAIIDSAPPAPPLPRAHGSRRPRRARRRAIAIAIPLSLLVVGVAAASITALVSTRPGVARLFIRTTQAGIAIRAYGASAGVRLPQIEVGLSTRQSAGYVTAIGQENPPGANWFFPVASTVFGRGTSGGSAVVISVGANVTTVRAVFSSGVRDSMHPVNGWAVLAEPGVAGGGRVLGYDASGNQVASAQVPSPTPSGEGFPGESIPTFSRVTAQGVLIIGHTVRSQANGPKWLYPYLANHASVQLGLEGVPACRPRSATGVDAGVLVVDAAEGEPMTVVVVHTGGAVSRVRVHFANGATDSMSPVAGQAILVTVHTLGRSSGRTTLKGAVLTAQGRNGQVLFRGRLSLGDSVYSGC